MKGLLTLSGTRRKKGSIDDLILIMVVVVIVGFVVLIGYNVLSTLNDKIQTTDFFDANAKSTFANVTSKFPGVIDNTFLLLTIGLCIIAMFLAYLVRFSPVFFVLFIVFVPILLFITAAFSNIYTEAADSAALSSAASDLVFMSHIVRWLPIIIGIMGFVLAFIMYSSWRNEV